MNDYWEKLKKMTSVNTEYYKNRFNESHHHVTNKTTETMQAAKQKIPDIQRGAKNIADHTSRAYTHIGQVGNSVSRFYRIGKYSMVAAGVGVLLLGTGYVLRPVADIYIEHNRGKNGVHSEEKK
jgi:hypothetical protein